MTAEGRQHSPAAASGTRTCTPYGIDPGHDLPTRPQQRLRAPQNSESRVSLSPKLHHHHSAPNPPRLGVVVSARPAPGGAFRNSACVTAPRCGLRRCAVRTSFALCPLPDLSNRSILHTQNAWKIRCVCACNLERFARAIGGAEDGEN